MDLTVIFRQFKKYQRVVLIFKINEIYRKTNYKVK